MNELQQRLKELSNSIKSSEYSHLQRVVSSPNDERLNVMPFWGDNQFLALYEWFVQKDLTKTKQHFYKCGRMLEYETKKFNAPILSYGISHFCYTLLSDCPKLIRAFADLTYESTPANRSHKEGIERGYNTPMYILQCLIKDDWKEYERVMPLMLAKSVKKYKMDLDVLVYEGIAERNKSKIEKALNSLLEPKNHKKRNIIEVINEYVSHPSVGYAKLAWYKGIEVEISSPLVPKEWLPIQPLKDEEYIDYDFVKTYLG